MELKSIFGFYEILKDDYLSFMYHGFFSDEFTDKIININEFNIEKNENISSFKNKVSFLVAESFQNVVRHGDIQRESEFVSEETGVFFLRIIDNTFYITSANLIKNENIKDLTDKLLHINELDKEGLKALHLKIINNTDYSEKGGAGLGLIDMAKKSGNKLEFDFEKIDDKYSFFYLQVKITSKNVATITNVPISSSRHFYNLMTKNNIFLIYNGDFSENTVPPILNIIKSNLFLNQFEITYNKKSIYVILSELLHNITKHSFAINNRKDGLFVIGKYRQNYFVSTGNFIENSKIRKFKRYLDMLNLVEKKDLVDMYEERIINKDDDHEDIKKSFGLMDIAKDSKDYISYNFHTIDNEISFVTLSVNF